MNIELYINNLKFIHPRPSGLVGRDAENRQKQKKALSSSPIFILFFWLSQNWKKKERKKERKKRRTLDATADWLTDWQNDFHEHWILF